MEGFCLMEELNRKGFVSAGLYYIGSGRGLMVGPYANSSKLCNITKKQSNFKEFQLIPEGVGLLDTTRTEPAELTDQ